MLLEHRTNVSAEDIHGRTPQDFANFRGRPQVVAMLQAAAVTRAKCGGFATGHHARLGVGTRVEGLDPEVLHMVLERVWPYGLYRTQNRGAWEPPSFPPVPGHQLLVRAGICLRVP